MNEAIGIVGRSSRVDLAVIPDFDLGGLRVLPCRRQICTVDGSCREIEPRIMQVLVALASAQGQVVSRDQLIQACWEGRIVGDDALNRCIVALRRLARQVAPRPFRIDTVARVGYTLVALGTRARHWPRRRFLVAAGAGLAAVAAAALWMLGGPHAGGRRQRLVVLPVNSDRGSAELAEGFSLETTALLSLVPDLEVVPAASVRGLPAGRRTPAAAARLLGASLVLSLEIRGRGRELTAGVQLLSAPAGTLLWGESFRRPAGELAALQQEVAVRTAQAVGVEASLPPVGGVGGSAYRRYLAGRRALHGYSERSREAMADFQLVVAEAPRFARAWSGLAAATYRVAHLENLTTSPMAGRTVLLGADRVPQVVHAARRAIALGEASPEPWEAMADAASFVGRWAEAAQAAEEALRKNGAPTQALRRLGRWRDMAEVLARAAALNSLSPDTFIYLAEALSNVGDHERAMVAARRAFALDRSSQSCFFLVEIAARGGFREEGQRLLSQERVLLAEAFAQNRPIDAALFSYMLGAGPRPDPRPVIEGVRRGETFPDAAIYYLAELGDIEGAEEVARFFGPVQWPTLYILLYRRLAAIRRRPFFWNLMARYGLLQYWRSSGRLPDFCRDEPCAPLQRA